MSIDAVLWRAGTPSVSVGDVDLLLAFDYSRESRTVVTPPAGIGVTRTIYPHGPRAGLFRFGFGGATARARASACEMSLATGLPHYLVNAALPEVDAWRWLVDGQISVERSHDVHGRFWIVTAAWTEQT